MDEDDAPLDELGPELFELRLEDLVAAGVPMEATRFGGGEVVTYAPPGAMERPVPGDLRLIYGVDVRDLHRWPLPADTPHPGWKLIIQDWQPSGWGPLSGYDRLHFEPHQVGELLDMVAYRSRWPSLGEAVDAAVGALDVHLTGSGRINADPGWLLRCQQRLEQWRKREGRGWR